MKIDGDIREISRPAVFMGHPLFPSYLIVSRQTSSLHLFNSDKKICLNTILCFPAIKESQKTVGKNSFNETKTRHLDKLFCFRSLH